MSTEGSTTSTPSGSTFSTPNSSSASFNPPHVSQVGYDLEKYINGTHPCPTQYLPNTTAISPEFAAWYRQDKIILSWILSSLTESVVSRVMGFSTSHGVWMALENQYASRSQAHLIQLQRELQTIRKGNLSMNDYLLHAKKIVDSLAAYGQPFSVPVVQQMILGGLDSVYDAIVTTLTATCSTTSMEDFQAHLMAFEMRLAA
ncbi:hypothetical protein BVC80_8359g5 [Macleaya cordata]|uniref:Retrotransposon gag domain-containing protein n=1 Tax=Macleaya cordata TaxID=56857 RepID=A0A200QFX8_MACCD|nr:hypothetical protein BVC80_8359g5 [Macleaya cordata]